jgi:hypothetical protein
MMFPRSRRVRALKVIFNSPLVLAFKMSVRRWESPGGTNVGKERANDQRKPIGPINTAGSVAVENAKVCKAELNLFTASSGDDAGRAARGC